MSGDNGFFQMDEDHDKNSYGVSTRIMLTAVFSLFAVVVLVIALHVYARYLLRRQERRRAVINQLHTVTASTQAQQAHEPPKTGLEPSVIAELPILAYRKTDGGGDVECSVCLSILEEEEMARILPNCKHMFHIQCIDMWLHSHSTCPICRTGAEPRVQEAIGQVGIAGGASAPPLESWNQTVSTALEGTSDNGAQSSKASGSTSRLNSFRRMLSRERSERRTVGDMERQ